MDNIEKLIRPLKNVIKVNPSVTVGSALENVKSSHDPVFVYDGLNFLGIVSGSQSFFKKRYPANTKVSSALTIPPKLTKDSSIFDVAKHMISTKIYTLPVFDADGKIIGVVSSKSILESVLLSTKILKQLKSIVKIEKPITAIMHSKVRDVYSLLRKEKTSRIVIVDDKDFRMRGLITRRDIQQVFMSTPSKGKSNRTKNNRTYIIDDKDLKKFDFPIGEFVNIKAVTLPIKSSLKSIITTLNTKKINSIVLVDNNMVAKGIVSIRTLLDALAKVEPVDKLSIMLSDKHKLLDKKVHDIVTDLLQKLEEKANRVSKIKNIRITLDANKNPKGYIKEFDIHLQVNFKSGKIADTKVKGRELIVAVREAVEKINSQIKLNHKEKRHQ